VTPANRRALIRASLALAGLFALGACGGGGGGGGGALPPTQPPIPPSGATFTPSGAAGANSISLAAGPGSGATVFVLDVEATDVTDLYGVSFELEFPSTLMRFRPNRTETGSFLRGDDRVDTELIIEEVPAGNLVIGYSRLGSVSGVSGSGLLLSLEFALLGNGSGSLDLKNTDVIDPFGETQTGVSWVGGSIIVSVN